MKTYSQPNIFIVEDDTFYSSLVKQHLTENKLINISVFNSGKDCLDNIYKMPQIVLLDYKLGDMKGLEVLKQIKSINANIEVIFLSAQEKLNVAIDALKYGAYDYVEKNDAALRRIIKLIHNVIKTHSIVIEGRAWKRERNLIIVSFTIIATVIGIGMKYSGII